MTQVVCENKVQDLGTITEGTMLRIIYKVTNVGLEDLYINGVSTSCGCTASSYKTTAVKSNEATEITLNFNSSGKKGSNEKTATVQGNFNHPLILTFKVKVV